MTRPPDPDRHIKLVYVLISTGLNIVLIAWPFSSWPGMVGTLGGCVLEVLLAVWMKRDVAKDRAAPPPED
jgi:hypothetical protein